MPDLNNQQFTLFPRPKLSGGARGFHGPLPNPDPDYTKEMTGNQHGVYLRYGDWPENERSMNHVTGGTEEGVSVYHMETQHAKPVDPDPDFNRYDRAKEDEWGSHFADEFGNDTGAEMNNRYHTALRAAKNEQTWEHPDDISSSRRAHFVRGTLVGFGHDDEPLLNDVQHVGHWPQDAHRFVPGTEGELVRHTNKYGWVKGF